MNNLQLTKGKALPSAVFLFAILFAPAAVGDGTPAFLSVPREMPCFDCLQKTHAGNFPPETSKLNKT